MKYKKQSKRSKICTRLYWKDVKMLLKVPYLKGLAESYPTVWQIKKGW